MEDPDNIRNLFCVSTVYILWLLLKNKNKEKGESGVPYSTITLCLLLRQGSHPVQTEASDWLGLLIAALPHCHSKAENAWAISEERDGTPG